GMESSMASMAARAQAADQSAAASEARAREMQNAQFELVQFCQKMVLERQAEQAKLEEAKARSETFKMLGAQAAPYVGPLMNVALEWWSTKRDKEKAELERIRNAGKHETPET